MQSLANRWSDKGYALGFGVGIAMGPATVGTIGYEGRLDYTAVGSAVNLASRLCDLAGDARILIDPVVADQVSGDVRVSWLGERTIKGYSRAMQVFAVVDGKNLPRQPRVTSPSRAREVIRLDGANPRAARHFGIDLPRLIIVAFLASGFLIGMAAAADILGLWGYIRTDWNPAYGDTIIPFVFLARLNMLAVVPFIAFFSILSTGGDLAAQQAGLPTDFLLVLVGLILLFMTVIEYLGRRRELGESYLSPGLKQALRAPIVRRHEA